MKKILVTLLLSVFFVILSCGGARVVQPIKFNHNLHVVTNNLECNVCHTMFSTQHTSGRPMIKTCAMCHSTQMGSSPEEKKLVEEYVTPGIEPQWQRLFRIRTDVYFSHRRHVVLGEIKCEVCHGDIKDMTEPPKEGKTPSMEKCIACHKENNVTVDCLACHV